MKSKPPPAKRVHVTRLLAEHPPPTPQPTACRLWQGSVSRKGYGYRPDHQQMHRWVWEQANGPIPAGMLVCHRCDQPLCYRLDHLFLGTPADNMADMASKGRSTRGRGVAGKVQTCEWCSRSYRRAYRTECCSKSCAMRRRRASQPEADHGTSGRYKRGCRCDKCRAANTARSRRRRQRLRATSTAAALVAALASTACSEQEVRAWVTWWERDPDAAVAFAEQPVVQADLRSPVANASEPNTSLQIHPDSVWNHIAACESGGRWDYPPVTNRTGTYSGGLMIGHRWWPAFGGTQYAPAPYLASRAEQIAVAERIAAENGLDAAWQCWPPR